MLFSSLALAAQAPAAPATANVATKAAAAASALPIADIVTNLGVFSLAVAAAIGGIYKAVKSIRKDEAVKLEPGKEGGTTKVMSAALMETTTMLMWSESNRHVGEKLDDTCDKLDDLKDQMVELRHVMTRLTDTIRDRV